MNKCCNNCIWNEDGFCDCKGYLVEDESTGCKSWENNNTSIKSEIRS